MAELFYENLFEDQIDSKVKSILANDFKQPETYTAEVLRKDSEGRWWVRFIGSDDETPIMVNKIDMRVGDIVTVTVKDHQSIADGNLTSPALSAANTYGYVDRVIADVIKASEAEIGYLKADVATIGYAQIQDADITNARIQNLVYEVTTNTNHLTAVDADILELQTNSLTANSAVITNLQAQTAKVQNLTAEELEASVAYIDDLSAGNVTAADIIADHAEVSDLDANYAHITDGVIDNATIGYADVDGLSANYAHVSDGAIDNATIGHARVSGLSANYAHITDGVIDNATIGYADVDGLSANYAEIDMANVNNAWIQNGAVKNAAITNEMVQSVSANKLTAGTIDASNITVTNLNADNITAGTLNGQRIGTGSLSLDKLSEDVYTEAEVDAKLDTMQAEIDGAIETWTGTDVPTLNNAPASSWTTSDDRRKHVGDVYFNTTSGYNYRFTENNNTYSWLQIKDTDITNALSRIQTAEGKIGNIEAFDVTMATFKTDTEGAISTLQTKTSNLETSLGDKVSTTTFNELSQTVDGNSSTITTLGTVLTNNGLTTSTNISNTVNSVQQTATSNSSKISQLTTTLGTNADGTTKTGDIVHRTSAVEQDLSGFKITVSSTYATVASIGSLEAPYTEVEWVESDGTQYVYLDWKPPMATWGFEADFIIRNNFVSSGIGAWNASTNASGYGSVFGVRNTSSINTFLLSSYTATGCLRIGNTTNCVASGNMLVDRMSRQTLKLHGTTFTTCTGATKTVTRATETADKPYANMTVFALHDGLRKSATGTVAEPGTVRIYSLKFYDGDELKVDLVGAVRNRDRMTGLYDKVKGHFYPAKGLLCGNEIGVLGEPDTISKALDKQNISVSIDNRLISRMWEAEVPTLDRLDDGQQITVVFSTGVGGSTPNAIVAAGYDDFTGWDEGAGTSYTSVYLKLTLSDGSNTGWIPCYYGQGTRLTGHYGSGTPVLMTYRENVLYNATTTSAGTPVMRAWYADPNYVDGNTTYTKYSDAVIAGKNGLKPYTLCMKDDAGNWTTIVNQAATGLNDKTCYTGGLQLGAVTYHITNGTYAAGANGGQLWESYGGIDFRRSANGITDNANTTTLQLRKPVYFVGTLDDDDGLFYLDTTKWWTQDLFVSGKVYVLVGHAYTSNNAIFLSAVNPSYIWNGTKLVEFSYSRIVQAETKIVQTDSSILSLAQANTTWTAPDGTTQTNQTAAKLQLKANKDTLTSEINASADTVKISADRVNIEGAAIFTSGRLSSTSLNNAYDAKGAASTAETNAKNYADAMEIGSRNLLLGTPITYVTGNYEAYKLAFNDPLEIGQKYTVQLWDVDVSHTGKTAAQLGVFVYIGGGSCNTGVHWQGTSYFTDGHADHLTGTFTYSQSMHDASGGTNKWLSLYNSVPSASGTQTMSVGKWKLEKGSKATDWTPAPEDLASASDAVEYIVGTQGAATNAWTGVTKESSLYAGKTISYYLPYAGTGSAATLNLTLSGGGTTGAKGIKYNSNNSANNNVTTHYGAGSVIQMTYDGLVWRVAASYWDTGGISNARYRTQWANAIKASTAITAKYIICGTSAGYANVAANAEFDLSYPLLYAEAAIALNATGTANYLTYNGVPITTTAAVQSATVNSMVYLRGTMNNGKFKCAASNYLTCVVPSQATNPIDVYIPLGIMYSTTAIYFESSKNLYAYLDGKFRQVTPTEIVATQRIYWRTDTVGIPTAPSSWVDEDDNVYKSWTTKVPPIAESVDADASYPYLYTCEQRKRLDGTVGCTQVLLDENTTIIDGGSIITNSIAANRLDISDVITVGGFASQEDVEGLDRYVRGEYYVLTEDATVQEGKVYYTQVIDGDSVEYTVSSAAVGSSASGLYELDNMISRLEGLGVKYDTVNDKYEDVAGLYDDLDSAINDNVNGVVAKLDKVSGDVNELSGGFSQLDSDFKSVLRLASDSVTLGQISNGTYAGCRAVLTSDSVDFVNSDGEIISSYGQGAQIGRLAETHIESSGDYLLFMPATKTSKGEDMSDLAVREAVLNDAVAYIAVSPNPPYESVFYMTRSVVVKDMFLGEGKWKFYKRENNNLSLKWLGGM